MVTNGRGDKRPGDRHGIWGVPGWPAGGTEGECADHLVWRPWDLRAVQNFGQTQESWPQCK